MTRITKVGVAFVLGAIVALGSAGCSGLSPIATEDSYDASDGVSLRSGDVIVNNALLISASGTTARLIGQITNTGTQSQSVTLQVQAASQKYTFTGTVDANSHVNLTEKAIVADLGVQPGATVPVYLQAGTSTGQLVDTPVLNGDLEQYASLVPTPSPSAAASSSATPAPSASASASPKH